MDAITIFRAVLLAERVGQYTGLLENSLGKRIEVLEKADMGAGLSTLEQAARSTQERTELLREARGHFNRATRVEKGLRLAQSYLGLAICHDGLKDVNNLRHALDAIQKVTLPEKMRLPALLEVGRAVWELLPNEESDLNALQDTAKILSVAYSLGPFAFLVPRQPWADRKEHLRAFLTGYSFPSSSDMAVGRLTQSTLAILDSETSQEEQISLVHTLLNDLQNKQMGIHESIIINILLAFTVEMKGDLTSALTHLHVAAASGPRFGERARALGSTLQSYAFVADAALSLVEGTAPFSKNYEVARLRSAITASLLDDTSETVQMNIATNSLLKQLEIDANNRGT